MRATIASPVIAYPRSAGKTWGSPVGSKATRPAASTRNSAPSQQPFGEDLRGSTLYFTRVGSDGTPKRSGKPYCTICSKAALDAGVSFFVLHHEEGVVAYPTDLYNEISFAYDGD